MSEQQEESTENTPRGKTSGKRVRFSEKVSVRQTVNSKSDPSRKKQKTSSSSKIRISSEQLPEDSEIAYQAKQARRVKQKQSNTAVGFDEDDSDEDVVLEAMGEAHPTEADTREMFRHGVSLEAFNMKEELDDGVVDPLSGVVNPRKSRDNDAKDEAWLVEFEENMKDKRYAARFNNAKKSIVKQSSEEDAPVEQVDKTAVLNDIADELLWGETVNSAMRRIRPKNTNKSNSEENTASKIKFNDFIEKVDKAVSVGVSSIYSMSKEEILDLLDTDKNKSLWEYKWTGDETIYGPMSAESMLKWSLQGYFAEHQDFGPVLVRKLPSEGFVNISTVDFSNEV
jgi:hypothetical protein